jgi:urease accessory protein
MPTRWLTITHTHRTTTATPTDPTVTADDPIRIDAAGLFAALQFADSMLPTGTHTASYGLEQFAAEEAIPDEGALRELLTDYLERQVGPGDVVVAGAAHGAAVEADLDGVEAADERLHETTLLAEFRESTTRSGRQFLDLLVETYDDPFVVDYRGRVADGRAPGTYPAVLGLACARTGVPRVATGFVCCHSFLVDALGAVQRVRRFSHVALQRVLVDLAPVAESVAAEYAHAPLDSIRPFAPRIDLASTDHERAERRLFRS